MNTVKAILCKENKKLLWLQAKTNMQQNKNKILSIIFIMLFLAPLPSLAKPPPNLPLPSKYANPSSLINYKMVTAHEITTPFTFLSSGDQMRLWGVSAPEEGSMNYTISHKILEVFIKGKALLCKNIPSNSTIKVVHCFISGKDIAMLMVKMGFLLDNKEESEGFYAAEENFAKDGKLGIWE